MNRRQFLGSAMALPAAAWSAPAKPNLLIVMTDQHRFSALSCAGNGVVQTPNLDRLAREGAMYRTAEDPFEMKNVIGSNRKQADEMKDQLLLYLDRAGSPLKSSVNERKLA